MLKLHYVFLALAVGALDFTARAASPDPQQTRQLLAVVQSNADLAARARALQQLALVATKDAVTPLTGLLADEKLGQYARDVLEQMPDPAAGEALRAALGTLKGKALIGVVNSLGVRRDEKAVAALGTLASGGDAPLAESALIALGRIGSRDALRMLEAALAQGNPGRRAAAAEACLIAAERQAREGKNAIALALYEKIRGAELPLPLRVSATRGAILLPGERGAALVIEQLHSPELAMRDMALLTIRELRDSKLTPRLVAELDRLGPEMQTLLVLALAERGDEGALPAIEAHARKAEGETRVAARRALSSIGRASSVPILLEALGSTSTPAVAEAARIALARVAAPETNALIRQAVSRADAPLRVKLIGLLGDRRVEEATADLLKLAADADVEVSKAAFRALGVLARPGDLPQLIRLAISAGDESVKSLADRAVVTTSMKLLHPERRADAVLAAFREQQDSATKAALVRPLGAIVRSMGGSHDAFFALRKALSDGSPAVRQAALVALADWPDATPAMMLIEMANDQNLPVRERETALSGAIRMATNVAAGRERSPLNVVTAFVQANRAVRTEAEKLMIVSGLGNLKRPEAVALLKPYLADDDVKSEAALAVVQIAPALRGGKAAGEIKEMLETIARNEQDENVRKQAVQLARGGPAQPAKEKGKGKKAAAKAAPAAVHGGLFNGQDLTGWEGDPAVWRVRDGAIVGGSLEGNPRNEFLATTRRFRNFALRLEYKLVGTEGFVNGGVQFRSVRVAEPPNEMIGYQADIGAGHSGSLYDESRRKKFLARANAGQIQQLEKAGDWNRYEIRCEGPKVTLALNGEPTLSYTEDDPGVELDGFIALQIHGNCKAEIAFRNFELVELP
jgi:HEAT repeat protein